MHEIDWSDCPAVWRDPGRMGGQWCFDETRLPIRLLFANLAEGVSMEQFCEWHPPVTRPQCEEVLAWIGQALAGASCRPGGGGGLDHGGRGIPDSVRFLIGSATWASLTGDAPEPVARAGGAVEG